MLSLDGGATWPHEVNPINGAKVRLAEKKNLDRGQLFFRTELTTHLSIGGDVFKLLWNLERRGSRRCEPLLIRLEQKCGFAWKIATWSFVYLASSKGPPLTSGWSVGWFGNWRKARRHHG